MFDFLGAMPKGFYKTPVEPVVPGQPVFDDLIAKDAEDAVAIAMHNLSVLRRGGVDGSVDLTVQSFDSYMAGLEARVNGK